MAKCVSTCVAETVIENSASRILSLIEVIENIASPIFPSVIPRINVIFFMKQDPGDPDTVTLQFKATLDSQVIIDRGVDVTFIAGDTRSRLVVCLQGFPAPAPGLLTFSILSHGQVLGDWEIPVAGSITTTGTTP